MFGNLWPVCKCHDFDSLILCRCTCKNTGKHKDCSKKSHAGNSENLKAWKWWKCALQNKSELHKLNWCCVSCFGNFGTWNYELMHSWNFEILRVWNFESMDAWSCDLLKSWSFVTLTFWTFWKFETLKSVEPWNFVTTTLQHNQCVWMFCNGW